MSKPNVYISRPLPKRVLEEAEKHFNTDVRQETLPMSPEDVRNVLARFDGFLPTLGDPLDAAAFTGDVRSKIIANFGVGYNHIDVAEARARGAVVTNTPGAVTEATADIALTLMLMTARRVGEGERLLRDGQWTGWHPTQLLGMHLGGKTVGIVGMGRIGKALARRAHLGLGMDVVFYNRSPVADAGVPAKQLDSIRDVMAQSDIVSIHIPGGGINRHAIGPDELAAMKPSAFIVNTARGDVINEAALVAALQAGKIAGAGLDVFEREPEVPQALTQMENVTLLPHLGTASLEVRENMGMMAVENLRAFFAGETPPNTV